MAVTARSANRPTALDLFAGVGGLSLGLLQAGFQLRGAVDNDQQALDAHRINFPDVPALKKDLFTAPGGELRAALGLREARLDLLAGGPPCQGFSSGGRRGERARQDPRNHGVMAFARLVTELRPRFFLMENVRGFLFSDHDALRERYVGTIRDAGYMLRPFALLNASDFGVPQRRLRAFVLGCREGEPLPEYPAPLRRPPPTVMDAIADLAVLDKVLPDPEVDAYDGPLDTQSDYARRLRLHPNGRPVRRLTGCLRSIHSTEVVERFSSTLPGGQEPVSRFFRLDWGGISPTIRAGTGPEHGSHTAPRPIHPDRPRCITVREGARLHSFPDWFQFRGTRWHGFRQIGNSVPPTLARAVAAVIARACKG